jgi:methionine-gamma-lyase
MHSIFILVTEMCRFFFGYDTSISSEIPLEEQAEMGLTDGLIRFSIGLDNYIERTYLSMNEFMSAFGVL